MKQTLIFILLTLFSCQLYAKATSSGKIATIYSTSSGAVALKLDVLFNDNAIAQCPTYNGFAGVKHDADPILKSMLLAAFSSGKRVNLVIDGCFGNWLNVVETFVFTE